MLNVLPITLSIAVLILSFFIAHLLIGILGEEALRHPGAEATKCAPRALTTSTPIDQSVKKLLLSTPSRVVDEICSEEEDDTCFEIIDEIIDDSNRLLAYRKLKRKGDEGILTLSKARIQPPTPLTEESSDTKTWKIRKDTVPLAYARLMIVGAFMCGALEFNTTRKQDVLVIGLGGGVINNYLTTMKNQKLNVTVVDIDPVMKQIAERWFDFEESPLHRVVIEDGVDFLRGAARRGEKYDVIFIDVSYNIILDLMGPTDDFLRDDVIKSMRAVIEGTGAVIVNIFASKGAIQEASNQVYSIYSRHFPSCFLLNHSKDDKVLFCSAGEKNSWNENKEELYERYVAVDEALGFQLSSEDPCSTYPLD
ncbi:hypothetical protein Y032_0049g1754 [Ancylostoma ceylanicum]|uniref:PABS domain-containing protein n=1 Tax=Ancylostoma ceylanicum TaxID=53326 RepID=A0A016UAX3_9BILA|nr:hypothetical protein Y032_0049g1754 [Ancylostoma ceylanicum]